MNYTANIGPEIIQNLGTSPYALWVYLKKRDFILPTIYEMANDFQRSPKTIQVWLRKLRLHGYIPSSLEYS
jgi:hypothetical protein